jgi:RNA polymerase sigma-70 factor (ECF subfamily)
MCEQEIITFDENNDNLKLKTNLLVAIKKLPEHQQVVIKLFYVEDYSLKQISDILKISIGTAKSRLFHAREKLKETLKYRNYEN